MPPPADHDGMLPDAPAPAVAAAGGDGGAGAGATSAVSDTPTDEEVAQGYFDDEISSIHRELDELKQSIAHLTASMTASMTERATSHHAGPSSPEPSGAAGGGPDPDTATSHAGQSVASASVPLEPEHNPTPSHRWWRPLRGE